MRWLSSVFALLLCNSALADFSASFTGTNFSGFTRNLTVGEWDSSTDTAGLLLDRSGSNLCSRSESFDHGNWAKLPATIVITADDTKAPDGTKTADLFSEGTVGSGNVTHSCVQAPAVVAATTYTFSVYAKYKTSGRPWVCLVNGTTAKVACFNIQTGTKGTVSSGSFSDIWSVTGGWYRIWFSTRSSGIADLWYIHSAESDGDYTYTGDGRGAYWLWGGQLALNDSYRGTGPGIYKKTVAFNKPLLDLSPTAAPTESKSYLQGSDGRRLKARTFNGSSQYYSFADTDCMDLSNMTITAVVASDSGSAATQGIMSHVETNVGGYGLEMVSGVPSAQFHRSGASTSVAGPSGNLRDGAYHIIQVTKNSYGIAVVRVDGVAGTPTNVSTYVSTATATMFFGAGLGNYFDGNGQYLRIDAEALSDEQLAIEREQIWGTLASSKSVYTKTNFTRASTATTTFSDGTLGYAAINIPRVSGDGGGVLVEEQRQNIIKQSQTLGTTWVAYSVSVESDTPTILAPDGTQTADILHETAVDTVHFIYQPGYALAVNTYTLSAYISPINRTWARLNMYQTPGGSKAAYFNVAQGYVGTVEPTGSASITCSASFCRCSFTFTTTDTLSELGVYAAEADNDITFVSADWDALAVWGVQLEIGPHPTSYIPTVASAVIRYPDYLTYEPWQISKNMFAPGAGQPMFWYNFDQPVYSGNTVTSSGGNYTLTTVGNPKLYSEANGSAYTSFDGVSDYFSISSGDFNPTGAFSIVAVYTPGVGVGTGNIISKDIVATRGPFQLLDNGGVPQLIVWNSADTTSTASGGALVANKTSLVTATYDGAGHTWVKTDLIAAGTGTGAITTPKATANLVYIGASAGAQQYLGDIRFIAYGNGVVITEAQHNSMYAALKANRGLPVKIGNSYQAKKLYIEFDAKCNFANKTGAGDAVFLFEISGNTGTADSNTNRILFLYGSDGKLYWEVWADGENTERYMLLNTVLIDMNTWHSYRAMYDFSNLVNSYAYRDSTSQNSTGDLSGAKNFDFTNTKVRINQNYIDSTAYSGCTVRKLKIRATP